MTPHLNRARVLLEQGKYEHAEQELRQVLLSEPGHGHAHSLLALCLISRKEYQEATREAEQGIACAPDDEFSHYALSYVFFKRNRPAEALAVIEETNRIAPYWAEGFGMKGNILLGLRRWQEALDAAEEGLALDPEDIDCVNVRGIALVKLGRKTEAEEIIRTALAHDPENADTHANMGWTSLNQGKPKEALTHFREALRLEPESEWARAGMLEALKARNPLYRMMLKYFLWASTLSSRAQMFLIVGFVVGQNVVRGFFEGIPGLAWMGTLILGLYLLFVFLTWMSSPLFNLALRLDQFGKHVLSKSERTAANWVGLFVFLPLPATWLLFQLMQAEAGEFDGIRSLSVMSWVKYLLCSIPVAAYFRSAEGWPRWTMLMFAAGVALVGYGGLLKGYFEASAVTALRAQNVALLGAVISTWVSVGSLQAQKRY